MSRRAHLLGLVAAGLGLVGCLDALLEAPYILATGLEAPQRMSPSPVGTILAATGAGLVEISGEGAVRVLDPEPVVALAVHPTRVTVLTPDGRLRWADWPLVDGPQRWSEQAMPGVHDIQSWCDDELRLASDAGLLRWAPGEVAPSPAPEVTPGAPLPTLSHLAMSATGGCAGVLALSADALLWITPAETRVLAAGLEAPQAVASDRHGGVWIVAGTPPALWFLTPEGPLERRARHLGDPRDLMFGPGELMDRRNAYLLVGGGRLDYVRVLLDSVP